MSRVRDFLRQEDGHTAAEFALVCLLFFGMMLGVLDMARLAWDLNASKAATRAGARFAIVNRPVPDELVDFNALTLVSAGQSVDADDVNVPDYRCTASGCTPGTANAAAFNAIVNRMRAYHGAIAASDVVVEYKHEGLGYAGFVGPDVEPLVTVTLNSRAFTPSALQVFGISFALPAVSTTLTGEDLS